MKTASHPGEVLTWYNNTGADVSSGDLIDVGGRCGVAVTDIADAASGAVSVTGVFGLTKGATFGLLAGDDVYRNEADKDAIVPWGPGAGPYVGKVETAVPAAATTTADVRLCESPGPYQIFEDFLGPIPAIDVECGGSPYLAMLNSSTKGGAPHAASDEAGGVVKFTFDAVSEACAAGFFPGYAPFLAKYGFICQMRLAIYALGGAAVDFNWGVASEFHATDMDSAAVGALFHVDGGATTLLCESDDGTTEVAATDTTDDAADDTYNIYTVMGIPDGTYLNLSFYKDGVELLSATTFRFALANIATARIGPIFHMEKTSDAAAPDARVDWVSFRGYR